MLRQYIIVAFLAITVNSLNVLVVFNENNYDQFVDQLAATNNVTLITSTLRNVSYLNEMDVETGRRRIEAEGLHFLSDDFDLIICENENLFINFGIILRKTPMFCFHPLLLKPFFKSYHESP